MINEKTITPKLSKAGTVEVNEQNQAGEQPTVWQVQLAWSRHRRGAWSPKNLSGRSLEVPLAFVQDGETIRQGPDRSSLYFRLTQDGRQLNVRCCSRPALTAAQVEVEINHPARIAAAKAAAGRGYDAVLGIWAQIPGLSDLTGAAFEAFLAQVTPENSERDEIAGFAKLTALFSLHRRSLQISQL